MEPDAADVTIREQIEEIQRERLPRLATRMLLHPRPHQALQDATMQDATELAAAEVVARGCEFADLTDAERADILNATFAECLKRNMAYLYQLENRN